MVFRLTISILVIIMIISLGMFSVTSISSVCEDIIKEISSAVTDGDINKLIAVREAWGNKTNMLSLLIPHDHIDSVSESMDRMIAYLKQDDSKEFAAEAETCLNRIRIIKNYDMPTLRTVF